MKIALLTNIVSPHQLPLAGALARRIGERNYRYIYTERSHVERTVMGWDGNETMPPWCRFIKHGDVFLETADLIYSEERTLDLFERRLQRQRKTYYVSERWFKPPLGIFRLLVPWYFRMAWRFSRCVRSKNFLCLPQGIHAARDMVRMLSLFRGNICCLFRAPRVAFESKPGGVIVPLDVAIAAGVLTQAEIAFARQHGFVQIPRKFWGKVRPSGCFSKLRIWGYFVAPGKGKDRLELPIRRPRKVLWVGRMLSLKCVAVLIRACCSCQDLNRVEISLDLYGHGSEEKRLRKLAAGARSICFHDYVPVEKVRDLMRSHDIYVLPSNGYEGWGAVVSEALEEGMCVLATIESGAGATMLPPGHLFNVGDERRLVNLLHGEIAKIPIDSWSAEYAADALLGLLEGNDDV